MSSAGVVQWEFPLLSSSERAYDTFLLSEENFGKRAFVIKNLLSDDECDRLVQFMEEKTTQSVPASSQKAARNHLRIVIQSISLGDQLLRRITKVLEEMGEAEVHVSDENKSNFIHNGIGMHGCWKLHSMNEQFRLCKYEPNGHFGPHYDSDYIVDPLTLRSLKTFMIYLNDDFAEGETAFVSEHDLHFDSDRSIYCAPDHVTIAALKPYKGDCLIFDHQMLHEGGQVKDGCKYIIRSDLLYKKDDNNTIANDGDTSNTHQAVRWYYEGVRLEESGDIDGAIRFYRKAFKLCPEIEQYMS
mmetsp:Transcript_3509/g.5791  ORF Transcript_3509/g.5791 Transcript_3509/m.5791 type:complete len:300 (+) Transcript_3509:45-944(+)